jgi:hypothetical protein
MTRAATSSAAYARGYKAGLEVAAQRMRDWLADARAHVEDVSSDLTAADRAAAQIWLDCFAAALAGAGR